LLSHCISIVSIVLSTVILETPYAFLKPYGIPEYQILMQFGMNIAFMGKNNFSGVQAVPYKNIAVN
jgi:hypothetical protein